MLAVGSLVGVIGTVALYYIFRAFGGREAGGSSHVGYMLALLLFVFICCAAFFRLAYWEG